MNNGKSPWAEVASRIRKELKEAFPNVKFKVRSESYTGGSSVNVYYTDGPSSDKVAPIVNKYQMGHFDGMTDMYEYSNRNSDLPQVKFTFTNREISKETLEKVKSEIGEKFAVDMNDEKAVNSKFGMWPDQVIYRETAKNDYYPIDTILKIC